MNAEQIVSTILIRDRYRYERMTYAIRVLCCLLGILALSVMGNIGLWSGADRFRYLMTQPSGRLMTMVPLSEPNLSDDEVARWAVDNITRVNTYDFANYRQQFTFAQTVLTGIGWAEFEKALHESGNFEAVIENRFVTTAVPTGPARVVRIGRSRGTDGSVRYIWQVTFPMNVSYRSSVNETSSEVTVKSIVVRMPEFINKSGLGIRQILMK